MDNFLAHFLGAQLPSPSPFFARTNKHACLDQGQRNRRRSLSCTPFLFCAKWSRCFFLISTIDNRTIFPKAGERELLCYYVCWMVTTCTGVIGRRGEGLSAWVRNVKRNDIATKQEEKSKDRKESRQQHSLCLSCWKTKCYAGKN